MGSTNRSLTFRWTPAKSATSYHVVGHSKITSTQTNTVTIHGLNPGSHYAFVVRAVGSQGLLSNSISCVDSTGESRCVSHLFGVSAHMHKILMQFGIIYKATTKAK